MTAPGSWAIRPSARVWCRRFIRSPITPALLLTTQHYYTPSGRLIQRDYSNISFLDYYYGKRTEPNNPTDVKQTDIGRVVYGGGGITPDEKFEAPKLDRVSD